MLLNRLKGGFVFRHKHTVLDRSGLAKWQISSVFPDQIALGEEGVGGVEEA
jgi:hypothetical protein